MWRRRLWEQDVSLLFVSFIAWIFAIYNYSWFLIQFFLIVRVFKHFLSNYHNYNTNSCGELHFNNVFGNEVFFQFLMTEKEKIEIRIIAFRVSSEWKREIFIDMPVTHTHLVMPTKCIIHTHTYTHTSTSTKCRRET